jgi:hypothetical protein
VLIVGVLVPDGVAGDAGIPFEMFSTSNAAVLFPQLFVAVTVIIPELVPAVTTIEVVPCPEVIVEPPGTTQV